MELFVENTKAAQIHQNNFENKLSEKQSKQDFPLFLFYFIYLNSII